MPSAPLINQDRYATSILGRFRSGHRNRRGATMAMLAILMPAMVAVAALVINLVYIEMVRTEMQIATDLATRAAGRTLAVTGDEVLATSAAERLLSENPVANQTLTLADTTIEFGESTRLHEADRYAFAPGPRPNAIRVVANPATDMPLIFPNMGVPVVMRPMKTAIATQVELDVALVLDCSGSMAFSATEISHGGAPSAAPVDWNYGDAVPPGSRWHDTVDAVNGFLEIMEQSIHEEQVSLSTYSSKAKTDVNLVNDYDAIRNQMTAISQNFQGGSTSLGDGIQAGGDSLQKPGARPWAMRVMIVMSDGRYNSGIDPVTAAEAAAAENILVYTVTFSDEANQEDMKQVAGAGAGQHYHASSSEQLADVFREIAQSLPTLITF